MEEGRNHLAGVFEREKARFLAFVRRQMDGFSGLDAEDIVADVTYRLLRRVDLVEEVENHFGNPRTPIDRVRSEKIAIKPSIPPSYL